jgi:hypothetical protein
MVASISERETAHSNSPQNAPFAPIFSAVSNFLSLSHPISRFLDILDPLHELPFGPLDENLSRRHRIIGVLHHPLRVRGLA